MSHEQTTYCAVLITKNQIEPRRTAIRLPYLQDKMNSRKLRLGSLD
jgi:hypothetical protein